MAHPLLRPHVTCAPWLWPQAARLLAGSPLSLTAEAIAAGAAAVRAEVAELLARGAAEGLLPVGLAVGQVRRRRGAGAGCCCCFVRHVQLVCCGCERCC